MKHIRLLLGALLAFCAMGLSAQDLAGQFASPPPSARPWVYWFWNNGNVTKAGITADLEAMKRAGVGGVIIMDVAERFAPPRGTAEFMNAEWQDLFCFALTEARRLGIEVNMTNGPGWCGSSGPWITPDLSMQMLVSAHFAVAGPTNFSGAVPRPPLPKRAKDPFNSSIKYNDYYGEIAVLAYPDPADGAVRAGAVVDLTGKMDARGNLNWRVPPGHWIIERIGHTTTGSSTRPPVAGGNGLECDKLSAKAMNVHFANMIGHLLKKAGSQADKALVATHIDSWEVGSQNWTPLLRKEFKKRRGYDPLPFLPNITAGQRKIGDAPTANRFRWDYEETIAELLAQNYTGRLETLAHQHGMRLTLEGYDLPFGDEATYTAPVDEPMSEFWTESDSAVTMRKARQMASVGHIYGHAVIGAESFTSGDGEKWGLHPALIKSLGDYEFCEGINRFVIHRYAHQPYLDRAPGATMGPWGLHYERTETWWEMSSAWHEYLARCQFMLRQGKFGADLCYLRPESPDQTYFTASPEPPPGYKYDECSAEALEKRITVKNGRLVLPDGMSYTVLVLPPAQSITPALARKVKELVEAGATVLANGPAPQCSPSLADYPRGDAEVVKLTAEIWGNCDGVKVTENRLGQGRLIWGQSLSKVLKNLNAPADFASRRQLNWIHRRVGGAEVYFVANPADRTVEADCNFRVAGMEPELWNPETGEMSRAACYKEGPDGISVPLHFDPSGSVFVVFRKHADSLRPVQSFLLEGESIFKGTAGPSIRIQKAVYGIPGDRQRTRDARAKLQTLVNGGRTEFKVSEMALGDDPALNVVKTLTVAYTINGEAREMSGRDPEELHLIESQPARPRAAEVKRGTQGELELLARQPGNYELMTADGTVYRTEVTNALPAQEIAGPWEVTFPAKRGAPPRITFDKLASWSDSTDEGVKHFSGTAMYSTTFEWNRAADEVWLDLGDVQIMADVQLNGRDLGILWKRPFRVNITGAVRAGHNDLEIRVVNLWANRLIGDAALPAAERFTWSSWEPFKKEDALLKSGLLGPVRLESVIAVPLR